MKKKKIEKTIIEFIMMEEMFKKLQVMGSVSFMIPSKKNYNILGELLKEFRLEELYSDDYKRCRNQLKVIKSNIIGDSQVFDDKKKEEFKKAAEEFWKTGKNKRVKEDTEKMKKEWEEKVRTEKHEVEFYCIEERFVPKELEEEKNKQLAILLVQLCDELILTT